jgi:hypothetical protein
VRLRRRQVDATAVRVGGVGVEPVGAAADDAAEDDVVEQLVLAERAGRVAHDAAGVVREDGELAAGQRDLDAVGEANPVRVPRVGRRLDDLAGRAARMCRRAVRAPHLDERDDLCADGEDEVRVVVADAHRFTAGLK